MSGTALIVDNTDRISRTLLCIIVVVSILSGFGIAIGLQLPFLYLLWVAMCWMAAFMLITFWYEKSGVDRRFLVKLFTMAFLVRLVLSALIYFNADWVYRDALVYSNWVYPDALNYITKGVALADLWRSGRMLSISEQLSFIGGLAHGYSIFNGLHLIIFEKGVHLPLITNSFLGGATTILVYRLGQKFVDQKVGRTGAYLVAFSPTLIFWSSVNLKEIILSFLICVAIYSFLRLKDTMSIKHIAVLLVCLVIILIVRIYIAVILGIAFSLSLLFGKYGLRKQIRGAIILLVSFGFIWFMVEQVPTIQSTFVEIMNLARGEILTESASDFSRTAERGHFMGQFSQAAPLTWLINAFHFLFSPSPYRLRWMLAGMLNIGTWIWIVLFPYFVFGVIYYRRQRLQALTPILLFMLGLVLAIAPFATRSGNRHKAQLLPLFFLMVSSGFIEYRSRPNGYLRLMIWIGIWVGITTFEFLL